MWKVMKAKPVSIKKAIVWVQKMVPMLPFPWNSKVTQTESSQVCTCSVQPFSSPPLNRTCPPPVLSSPCSLPKGPPPFWRFKALSCLTPKSSSSCKGRSTGLSAAQRAALRARTHHQGHPYGQIPVHLSAPALHTCTILRGKLYKEGSVTYTSTLKMKRGLNNT